MSLVLRGSGRASFFSHFFAWKFYPPHWLFIWPCKRAPSIAPGCTLLVRPIFGFFLALGAAAVGLAFFLYAAWSAMHGGPAKIGIITGALVEAISAIGFYLYGRAASQFGSFHICLERMNRFLIANSVCESMEPQKRDEARSALVDVMAHAPLLTFDIMSGRSTTERSSRNRERDSIETAAATNGLKSRTL